MAIRRCIAFLCLCTIFGVAAAFVAARWRIQLPPGIAARLSAGPAKSATPKFAQAGTPQLVSSKIANIPLSFEEIRLPGTRREFVSRGAGYSFSLGAAGAILNHRAKIQVGSNGDFLSAIRFMRSSTQLVSSEVRLTLMGANPNARAEGIARQRGTSNYILGNNPKKWRTNVSHYGRVRIESLYRGIDLVYHGNGNRVEMDYVIAPHAEPDAIRVGIGGPSLVSIDPQGNLSISSAGDEVLLRAPVAYQEKDGRRQVVDARYVLKSSHEVGFALGNYDPSQPLTIDPVLDFAAVFGGGDDVISDVVADTTGVYMTGTTCDVSYPVTGSALEQSGGSTTALACNDVIITKLDPTASSLIYSTYIGGSSVDFASRMLVDSSGNVLLGGTTASTDFPTTSGSYQPPSKAGQCSYGPYIRMQPCSYGFVLRLNATGSNLLQSTLIGGERLDLLLALAQDSKGDIYIAGATNSTRLLIPGPAAQSQYGGDNGKCGSGGVTPAVNVPCLDAFVAELSQDGTKLLASTYLGGNEDDGATALTLDAGDNIYVTGGAESGSGGSTNFPTTAGSFQPTHAGTTDQNDVFVTKLNSSLSQIAYSTFIGGSAHEFSSRIRVDSTGAAYVSGSTASSDFKTTAGAFQSTYAGPSTDNCPISLDAVGHLLLTCGDVFVSKLSPDGSKLVFSTYLGGSMDEGALNMALDSQNNVWVSGTTASIITAPVFPLTGDAYWSSASIGSAFLSEIKADGSALLFSTRLPGSAGYALNIDGADDVLVAGDAVTNFGGLNPATPGTYSNGQSGLFLVKFSAGTSHPDLSISSTSPEFTNIAGVFQIMFPQSQPSSVSASVPVTLQNTGAGTLHLAISVLANASTAPSPNFFETDTCGYSLAPSASCTLNVYYQPGPAAAGPPLSADSATIWIQDDAPNTPQEIFLNGTNATTLTASFIPATLDFGRRAAGTTSQTQSSILNGTGQLGPKTLGAFTTSGDTADFTVTGTSCAIGSFFCTITAQFSPQSTASPGVKMMTVSVPTNAPGSPQALTFTGTVTTSPVLAVSLNTVNLFPADEGTTGTSTAIGLSNVGGGTLTFSGAGMAFSNLVFSYDKTSGCGSNPGGITLAPQAACTFDISFSPTASTPGLQTGTLTFTSNDASAPVVNISGYGSVASSAHLIFTPSIGGLVNGVYQFADTIVGQSTAPLANLSTLQNLMLSGNGSATITKISLSDSDFTLDQTDTSSTNGCPGTIPITLTAGNTCTVYVFFTPQATGVRTGSLMIQAHDATGTTSTFTANFMGNGVHEPAVALSPSTLDFGKLAVGQTSSPLKSTLTNTGGAPLAINIAPLASPFSQTNNCPASLAGGAACTFTVQFTPATAGPASALLAFSTNAAGGGSAIGLSGSGGTGALLAAQPSALSFIGQEIGTAGTAQPVTLQNVGSTAATISAVHTTTNFTQANNCPASLAPQASCVINVTFAPTTDNFPDFTVNGTVLIDNSSPDSPLAIHLTGTSLASTAAATTTTLVSSANPSTVGQPVTFTATVSSTTAGSPAGYVTIYDGSTQLVRQFISATAAVLSYQSSNLAPGPHVIYATFNGDQTFDSSTSNFITQIENTPGKIASTTTVKSLANPANAGQSVTFTAAVTPGTGGTGVPVGAVTFTDGGTTLGSGTLDGAGNATLTLSTLASGNHNIFASYAGDTNYNGSASSELSQVINALAKTNTTTALSSSANPSTSGQSVMFTASVTPASGTAAPSGTISFTDGGTALGSPVSLDGTGKARFATSTLSVATHTILASYSGDTNFNSSVSNTVSQVVNAATKMNTMTALGSSLNPSGISQSVTFTATVTPASGSGVPNGTVSFADGASAIAGSPVTLDNTGKAMLTTSVLTVGNHTISASYSGDPNFNASNSNSVTQVVGNFTVAVQQSSLTVTAGQNGTLNVTVTPTNGFNQTVNLNCSGLPANSSCGASSVTLDGVHAASTTITIMTTARASAPASPRQPATPSRRQLLPAWIAVLAGLALWMAFSTRLRKRMALGFIAVAIAFVLFACNSGGGGGGAGGGGGGTPAGTYSVTISGAAGASINSAPTVILTVN